MSVNLNSTIEELDFYFFNVEVSELVLEITNAFNSNPQLPGIILLEKNQLVGLISRTSFLQYMSRPYSLEIAGKRPIKSLLSLMKIQKFIIPKNMSIIEAAKKSLKRSPDSINEPIIIEIAPQKYGVIDAHELLVYQAHIHEYTCELLTQMYGQLESVNKELKVANQKLENLSRLDSLTQVANRRSFNQYLQAEWKRGKQQKKPLGLIICSIDYFTEYNNKYGTLSGDFCLQVIAETIKNYLEKNEDLLARYDGAKFAIAMPNTNAIEASIFAENILKKVTKLAIENSQSQISNLLSLSVGVASILPTENNLPKQLTNAAITALDRAKQQGGNCKVICNSSESDRQINSNRSD